MKPWSSQVILLVEICLICFIAIYCVNSQNVTVEKPNIALVFGEIGTLKWLLKKGNVFNAINTPKVYWGDRADQNKLLLDTVGQPTKFGKTLFDNRLSNGRFVGDIVNDTEVGFELNLTNVQYRDRGQIYCKVFFDSALDDSDRVFKDIIIALNVQGGPDFCKENQTTVKLESNLTVTLCGNPPPSLTYGLTEDKIEWPIDPERRSEQEWFIHDYSLIYKEEYCSKNLHFNASGHNSKSLIWSPEIKVESSCESPDTSKKSVIVKVVIPIIIVLMLCGIVVGLALYWKKKLCFKKKVELKHGSELKSDTDRLNTPA